MIEIVQDQEFLRKVCESATRAEAEEIWPKLEASLEGRSGWGMAANQIGILKRVALINYNGKILKLLNPKIIELINPSIYRGEGCFSVEDVRVDTVRARDVVFENEVNGEIQRIYVNMDMDGHLPIIIQHEVGHLNGELMIDYKQKPIQIAERDKIGRNSPCRCGSGKKWKRCCLGRIK